MRFQARPAWVSLLLFGSIGGGPLPAQVFVTVDNTRSVLQKIDMPTLTITDIGPLGVTFSYGDLAWNPYTSTLYMVDGRGAQSLYTVNVTTGAATLVGSHGITDLFGLAFDTLNATLYATGFNNTTLYSLNPATGAATAIGSTIVRLGALAYDSRRDMLVGFNDGPGDLYQVNINTGATTLLASPGSNNDSGATYDPGLDRLFDADVNGNLYSYHIASGYVRTTLLSGLATHDGLANISAVPEPGTFALLMTGLVLVGSCRAGRRHRRRD
jgi:hypothetical protein